MTHSEEVLDSPHLPAEDTYALIGWWEKKRWWYNVLVGITGLMVLAISGVWTRLATFEWIGIVVYGLFANVGYTLGWAAHFLFRHYFDLTVVAQYRQALYFIGTVGSILLTYWLARWYVFNWLFGAL